VFKVEKDQAAGASGEDTVEIVGHVLKISLNFQRLRELIRSARF